MGRELATNGRTAAEPAREASPGRGYTVADVEVMARHAAASQLFGMNAPQAFTLMMICQSEGLDPIQALRRYHIIEGKPSMRADAMLAEFQRQGGSIEWVSWDERGCSAIMRHPRHAPSGLPVAFTERDAERAQLLGRRNWQCYPAAMYRARVISSGVRMILPGIVAGIYTPEEIQDSDFDTRGPRTGPRPWRGPLPTPAPPAGPGIVPRPEPAEPPAATAPAPAEAPPASGLRAYVRARLQAANDELRNELSLAGRLEPGRRIAVATEFQVANGLVSAWVRGGLIAEAEILGPNGKRDRDRAAATMLRLHRENPAAVEASVRGYIADKRLEAFREAGLEPPDRDGYEDDDQADGDRDEAQATADEDGPDGSE